MLWLLAGVPMEARDQALFSTPTRRHLVPTAWTTRSTLQIAPQLIAQLGCTHILKDSYERMSSSQSHFQSMLTQCCSLPALSHLYSRTSTGLSMCLGDSHGDDGECPAVCREAQGVGSADDKGLQEVGPMGVENALQGEHWASAMFRKLPHS